MAKLLDAELRFDVKGIERGLTEIELKQLPYATSLALNETAKGGRLAVQARMRVVFDRPTPFALRGVVYERATKRDLTAKVAIYGSRTGSGGLPAAYFLGPSVEGGMRSLKAFEVQLKDRGLLAPGHVAVPAERTRLDRYGNVPQSFLNRVMADLQIDYRGAGAERARTERSLKRNRNYSNARFFVPPKGSGLHPGVYQRKPGTREVFPVMLFVAQRRYAERLAFHQVVAEHADRAWADNFTAAFAKAMRSAR